ncbi:hypothetical protein GPEL0_01r0093 [Geoanaerobacter pelophilus]|uniref:Uncharacterized protein n=1 Tax=Geoanaerobacter pelophilus TaxID=60036 RepID=A0ABQ0MDV0_9BACT|nr:hypothetical protein GPEL0_01r0093 [Geoanaerobacter pelophilus]
MLLKARTGLWEQNKPRRRRQESKVSKQRFAGSGSDGAQIKEAAKLYEENTL